MALEQQVVQQNLKVWLERRLPEAQDLQIRVFEKTSSGTSNVTYFLTIDYQTPSGGATEELVVRWAPETAGLLHSYDLMEQFKLMDHLRSSRIPVPEVLWFEDDSAIVGGPFFVMRRIEGEVLDLDPGSPGFQKLRDTSAEGRRQLWEQAIAIIAQIHSLDWKRLGLTFLRGSLGPRDAIDREIAWWEELFRYSRVDVPILDRAFDRVKKQRPLPSGIGLCWGDARLGNLLFRDGRVNGVLDWEMAYIGPPECDVMYLCVMNETMSSLLGLPELEGTPTTIEACEYYERVSERELEELEFHEFFATLKAAVGLCRAGALLEEAGVTGFPEGFFTDNPATQKLSLVLGTSS